MEHCDIVVLIYHQANLAVLCHFRAFALISLLPMHVLVLSCQVYISLFAYWTCLVLEFGAMRGTYTGSFISILLLCHLISSSKPSSLHRHGFNSKVVSTL